MKAYNVSFKYSNKVELLDVVMELFSITVLEKELSYREKCVLREYLNTGYNANTKRAIRANLGINVYNLNTLNYTLQKKGFLKPHPNNQRLKLINDELVNLKNVFLEHEGRRMFLVEFVKADEV